MKNRQSRKVGEHNYISLSRVCPEKRLKLGLLSQPFNWTYSTGRKCCPDVKNRSGSMTGVPPKFNRNPIFPLSQK